MHGCLPADAQIVTNQATNAADNSPGKGISTKRIGNNRTTKRADATALKIIVKTS